MIRQDTLNPWPLWDNMPADLRYDRLASPIGISEAAVGAAALG